MTLSRRALLGAAACSTLLSRRLRAATGARLKIGLLLPYSGTYAALGHNITDGMKLADRMELTQRLYSQIRHALQSA